MEVPDFPEERRTKLISLVSKKFSIKIVAILLGAALLCTECAFAESAVGDSFPSITLANAETNSEEDVGKVFEGSVGALVYMQTSCAVCRRELQVLKSLAEKIPFKIAAVSVDVSPGRVAKYKEHFEFDFPFFMDPEFKTPSLFGFAYTPALVLIDKQGKIAELKGGFRSGDEALLEKKIEELRGK